MEWLITGVIETRYPSFLVEERKCIPWGGMEGVCRVIVGCMQPDGWKITSVNPNGDWFSEWRRLLLEWSCSSMLRSLLPVDGQSL